MLRAREVDRSSQFRTETVQLLKVRYTYLLGPRELRHEA